MYRNNSRGQLSTEFLIILAGLLLVFATITFPTYYRSRADAEKMSATSEAREAANTIANALNSVYAAGPGSKVTVEYWLPGNVIDVRMIGYDDLGVDGIVVFDGVVPANGSGDVQIMMDSNIDGVWDNTRESVVVIDTMLPSRWDNGVERSDGWINEYGVHVEEDNLKVGPSYVTTGTRTLHQTTFVYVFDSGRDYRRLIVVYDNIIGGS